MRILLLCSSDLNACLNLNHLLPFFLAKHNVHVMLSNYELELERGNVYANTKIWYEKDFIRDHFFKAIDTYGSEYGLADAKLLTFTGLTQKYSLEFTHLLPKTAKQHILEKTLSFKPDVIFCCRFDHILPEQVFLLPKLGAYNMHSGLLPQCAGADATFWAMYHGWESSGCTVHCISKEVDKGNIVASVRYPINYHYGVLWNRTQAYAKGMKLVEEITKQLEQGQRLVGQAQDMANYTYYPFPNAQDFTTLYNNLEGLTEAKGYARLLQPFLPSGMSMPDFTPVF